MADEKAGRKPDKAGGAGVEKDEPESAEAGGRHRRYRSHYTCWHDHAHNYVDSDWVWFTCWRCFSLNHMH